LRTCICAVHYCCCACVNCEAKKAIACACACANIGARSALMNACACACSCVVKSCPCKWGAGVSDAGVGWSKVLGVC
jgi:hypothetical protein